MSLNVGQPIDRVDGFLKVTGAARYAAEFAHQGLAHSVLLQSTISKGKIVSINTEQAKRAPGVIAVITHLNAPKLNKAPQAELGGPDGSAAQNWVPLQSEMVYYDGQHIGVVVADTLEQANYAASLVKVTYKEEQPDIGIKTSPLFTPQNLARKPATYSRGDTEKGLKRAAVHIDQRYSTAVDHHSPIEPHATIAAWDGDHLTIYEPTQWLVGVQMALAAMLGIPEANIRVVSPFIGGGFGCKVFVWPHSALAAVAAKRVGRPVRLVLTRRQMFTSVGYRPESSHRLTLGADQEGKLLAIVHEATVKTDVFPEDDVGVAPVTQATPMMYACENVTTVHHLARANVGPSVIMRGPSESPNLFALECALDELAYALDIDPIELRLRNYTEINPERGIPWTSKHLRECYQIGAEKFGWSKRPSEPGAMRDGRYLVGWGMASSVYPAPRKPASARAQVFADGSALLQCASHDLGTGAYTIFTQIAADALGLPLVKVRVELGDSNFPVGPVTGLSMTSGSVGPAFQAAGEAARQKIVALALDDPESPLYGIDVENIAVDDGRMFSVAEPQKGETYTAILSRHKIYKVEAVADVGPGEETKQYAMNSFGAQFAEVRVDPALGLVRVSRFVGVYDGGRILNPKTARSQMLGGIIGGIGMALSERTVYDPNNGRIVNGTLWNYLLPVCADVGNIEAYFVNEPDLHTNPLGVKGVGEVCLVGVAPAIANAIYHATGKRIRELPITPDKLILTGEVTAVCKTTISQPKPLPAKEKTMNAKTEKTLPPDLESYRDSYAKLFGGVPPLPAARFDFAADVDPEFLRKAEVLRAHVFYSNVFDQKTIQLMCFGILLAQGVPAAAEHAKAARKLGASWQELWFMCELGTVIAGGLGPVNQGGGILDKLRKEEEGQEKRLG